MKKHLLLLYILFGISVYSQSIPTPDYSHRFAGSVLHPNFTVGNNITTTTDRFGYENNAALLSPNHGEFSLNIPSNSALKEQGTISFWFKHTALGSHTINESRPMVYMHNGNSNFYEGIMLANSNETNPNKLRYASYRNSSSGVVGYSATSYNTTDWVHYAISYKFGTGGYYKIYVNGVLSDNISMNHSIGDLAVHDKVTFLGITSSLGWASLSGYLDDILVYNTNLTNTQINNIYQETYTNPVVVNRLLYKFDGNLTDYFGNYNLSTYGNFVYSSNNLNQLSKSGAFNIGGGTGVRGEIPTAFNSKVSGENFSVSFAIKPGNILTEDSGMGSGDGIYRPIVVIPSNTSTGYSLSERLYIGVNFSDRKLIVRQNQQVLTSNTILDNHSSVWYYVSVTVDQNNIKLYVNGTLDSTLSLNSSLSPISTLEPICIAHMFNGNNNYYYRGLIDELFFASVTHSANTVSNMYTEYSSNGNTLSANTVGFSENNFKIFPNPTKGVVSFTEQVSNIIVYDLQGRKVQEKHNSDFIDLSTQSNGIYLLNISTDNGSFFKRIIKK